MSSCWQTVQDYALRSLGYGERLLPRSDITLCEQVTLIGSGMLWNIYFGFLALFLGFFLANVLALFKASRHAYLKKPAEWFIFIFRGSPLFIQFFLMYELLQLLPRAGIDVFGLSIQTAWTTKAWAGALFVLFLNTAAYSAEIFYGALVAVPKGDLEAADAYGMNAWQKFRRIEWPTMLRLAWPSYTNEAIFLFHSTTLVFFSGFPAIQQSADAFYYANYFADKTFNPFVPYPIIAVYFILATLLVIFVFGKVNKWLNRYLPTNGPAKISLLKQILR